MDFKVINIEETTPFVVDKSALVIQEKKKKCVSKTCCIVFLGILILLCVIFIAVYYYISQSNKTINLSISDLLKNWDTSKKWNIVKYVYGKDLLTKKDDYLIAKYPKGSWAPSAGSTYGYGGFNFYAQPRIFPTNEVCFKYDVKFVDNFQWVKGGKLPGVWIGDIGASGGNHISTGYSYRLSWKQNGEAQAYVYIPNNQLSNITMEDGYVSSDIYGDALWRGFVNFTQNEWYSISLYIKLNTFHKDIPNYDGIIGIKINNDTRIYSNLLWSNSKMLINGIMMDSFFGGSDESWATPNTTYIYFKNFIVNNRQKCV